MTHEGLTFIGVSIHADECETLREIIVDWIADRSTPLPLDPKTELAFRLLRRLDPEELPE